jgi:hypothetical protein
MRDQGFKSSCAVRFEGENGWVEADDSGQIYTSSPDLIERRKTKGEDWKKPLGHTGNFIKCVKSRRTPVAPAEELHYPHLACHASAAHRGVCKRETGRNNSSVLYLQKFNHRPIKTI